MQMFMNKLTVFLRLKSEMTYRKHYRNVKLWANNSTGVLRWYKTREKFAQQPYTWKLSHCMFYLLNTWICSQLRGKSKMTMYTFTLNPLPMHHFNLLLEADGRLYKKIWNTKALRVRELSLLAFQACCCSEEFQHFIYKLKL